MSAFADTSIGSSLVLVISVLAEDAGRDNLGNTGAWGLGMPKQTKSRETSQSTREETTL